MKQTLTSLAVLLLLSNNLYGQITNGQINYEIRVDEYSQDYDNDFWTDDDHEFRTGLLSDGHSGGSTAWSTFGPGCGANNSVYYWQVDAPSSSPGNQNALLYYALNRSGSPANVRIQGESWEEDGTWDCSGAGDAGRWIGYYDVTISSAVKTPSNWWGPDNVLNGEWVNEDWSVTTGTRQGDARIKSVWRYSNGAACGTPLLFGTLANGTTYSHTNANRATPSGASTTMGYSNVSGNTSSDVFYSFTLSSSATVTISTSDGGTNYDTYLRLYDSGCGTQLALDDDSGTGTTSTITTTLCAGTYSVQVEGFSSNTGDFVLSVVANYLTLTGGTIAGITNGVSICSGLDPGSFTSTAAASNGVPTYTYQWQQSTTSAVAGFSDIGSATSATYDPGTLTQTTWFRRRVTDNCGNVAYSNAIQVVIQSASTAPTIGGPYTVCLGNSVTLTASGGTAGTGSNIYWYTGSNGTGAFVGTGTSISVSPTTTTTYYARREGTCNTTADDSETVTVNGVSTSGLTAGDYLWRGASSNNWNTAANWYVYSGSAYTVAGAAPTNTTNVFIDAPSTCTTYNPATAGNCYAQNVTVMNGGLLTLGSASTLYIDGSWYNNSGNTANVTANANSTVSFTNSAFPTREIDGTTSTLFNIFTTDYNGYIDINIQTTVENVLNMNGSFWLNERLILGTSSSSTGTLNYTPVNGWMAGPSYFRRYFAGSTNSGTSGLYPLGAMPSIFYRGATIEYSTAPSGGWIDGRFVSSTLSFYNGLPILNDSGVDIFNYMDEGYWELIPGGGMTGGTYTLTLRYDGIGGIVTASSLRIIKSPDPHTTWIADGTHGGVTANSVIRNGMSGFSWFVISSEPFNPLAVTLSHSSILCEDKQVSVEWTTLTEIDADYFSIETVDEYGDWKEIGRLDAKGQSGNGSSYTLSVPHDMRWTDAYRLVEVDLNGKREVLKQMVSPCEEDDSEIGVYPNPSNGKFTLFVNNPSSTEQAQAVLMDAMGRVVLQRELEAAKGANYWEIDQSDLNPGTYYLRISLSDRPLPVQTVVIR